MNSKKVFLVTAFSGDNFGSSLQAFALKEFVSRTFGVDCCIVSRKEHGITGFSYLCRRKLIIFFKSILFPSQFKKTWSSHLHKSSVAKYNDSIQSSFLSFTNNILKVETFNYKQLKQKSRENDCILCLCGSDQIWNPSNLYLSELNFLTFAPPNKRVSYACSIGLNLIPKYNKHCLKKYLKNFQSISVRERTAFELIKSNYNFQSTVCVDPTILVGKDFWENHIIKTDNDDYDFIYFIDKPSLYAINNLNDYYSKTKKRVYLLSKNDFDFLFDYIPVKECDPFLFISLIANAKNVFTDSFHGAILSTMFNCKFVVFERNYGSERKQSSRILDFLAFIKLSDCFVDYDGCDLNAMLNKIDFKEANVIIEKLMLDSRKYLKDVFENVK